MPAEDRRPLKTRGTAWAQALAKRLTQWGLEPNHISCLSMIFALLGGICLLGGEYNPGLLWVTAACIQLRLLCNLMDGMVAIEGGRQTPTGPFFNEFPDRVADVFLVVPLGYILFHAWMGWAIAVLVLFTAYVRALGASLGQPQDFCGPMAKPHRMAALTIGCVLGAVESWTFHTSVVLTLTAWVLLLGTAATVARRSVNLVVRLKEAAEKDPS
jgi:phosphatidylglycerophosphate synthase